MERNMGVKYKGKETGCEAGSNGRRGFQYY